MKVTVSNVCLSFLLPFLTEVSILTLQIPIFSKNTVKYMGNNLYILLKKIISTTAYFSFAAGFRPLIDKTKLHWRVVGGYPPWAELVDC